ncbi:MAG: hypothetical protein KBC57_13250 [Neisseriaceae bacterium]|nr:hypothetical protein [Neisseriaceae bacterium]MBP6863307.1 hypothetical protein [Neisseriaceae bacterium]
MNTKYTLILDLFANFLAPWLLFTWLEPSLGSFQALLASAVPPIAWSLIELIRHRRVDAISLLVIGGIALSLLAMGFGADERVLLMRESWITGGMGVMLLGSALIKRPLLPILIGAIMRRQAVATEKQQALAHPLFQASLATSTWVWGLGLLLEAGIRLWMAASWPIADNLLYGPIVSYGIMLLLVLWLVVHHHRRMRQRRY